MTKAKFVTADGEKTIPVHFNPSEYSVTAGVETQNAGGAHMSDEMSERLSMSLVFDTYNMDSGQWGKDHKPAEREDVRMYTEPIVSLSARVKGDRPRVRFVWGSLNFTGIIVSVSQKFTMFMDDGKPVRAVLDIVMQGGTGEVKPSGAVRAIDWSDNSWKDNMRIANVRSLLGGEDSV